MSELRVVREIKDGKHGRGLAMPNPNNLSGYLYQLKLEGFKSKIITPATHKQKIRIRLVSQHPIATKPHRFLSRNGTL